MGQLGSRGQLTSSGIGESRQRFAQAFRLATTERVVKSVRRCSGRERNFELWAVVKNK